MPESLEFEALSLSLKVALLSTLCSLPFAIAAAWLLARVRFRGKLLFDALLHAPLALPPIAVGYFLLLSFGTRAPFGHWLKETLHIQLVFTTAGAIVAASVMSFPLFVRAIRLSIDNVDKGLEVAARTLGATPGDIFWSITLPLVLPGILSGALMAFVRGLGEFGATIVFASNIAGETRTLPLAIYTATQTPGGEALALRLAALSMMLAVAALLLMRPMEHRLQRWLGLG